MTALRIIAGLMLALVVSVVNGIAAVGYTIGGEFEMSMQAAFDGGIESDSRWESGQAEDGTITKSPRDWKAAISLLGETKHGRFGLALQVFCLLQFIAGVLLVFRRAAGVTLATFLVLVGLGGIAVEVVGTKYSSSWGVTNVVGAVVSFLVIVVACCMRRATKASNAVSETALST